MIVADTTFAERLTQLREAAGISQYELARRAGLSKQALSKLELSQTEPTWNTVQRLAIALGVSVEKFASMDAGDIEPPAPTRPRGRPRRQQEDEPKKGRKKKG